MTAAQQALSALADWIKASSQNYQTRLATVERGSFAVLVPLALDQAPAPIFDPGALPLWIPAAQAPADLPAIDTSAPASQDHKAQRLGHIVWMVQEERFPGVQLIDLTDPSETLQAALDREAPGLDLDQTAAVFLPRW
ncbi:hypothetical protein ACOAOW_13630 [Pseudomonas aeruginosa]|uniref:hypothetical protein n=1 Tax=Pseudomonas aeruginosa TaxID=287 RepID=UPI000F83024B|nr:hypothetical protein [Pseudomonas aeruginosa]MBH3609327.1 hypothetical protein [Pseudomonas aeruginosa]MCS9824878.1 hypothetical protein [Pseudomonas aeruginosa]RTU76523.1 hypothetical protein DY982_13885 [Pseudomonas aeruginosa]WCV20024.1 hypothetical protein KKY51_02950 [Pseudomonas aeruginosa]HBP6760455.1 hypothetical protein [Pseudomonas aeruginosa]